MNQHESHKTSGIPREANNRRVGRPRQFWTTNTMEKPWEIMKREDASLSLDTFDRSKTVT